MDGHGPYAQFITYSLLIVPCAWLLVSFFKDKLGRAFGRLPDIETQQRMLEYFQNI